jgi:general secretion pathway protein G
MTPHTTRHHGFTLIELLIVITIIAVLASLILAASRSVQDKGYRSRAEAEIAAIAAALESYKADNGDYPSNSSSNNCLNLVTNLMPPAGSGGKVYFEFKAKATNSSGWSDPWGQNNYRYIYTNGSPNNGANNYDLWSTANNTNGNTNSWIKNW